MSTRSCWPTARRGTGSSSWSSVAAADRRGGRRARRPLPAGVDTSVDGAFRVDGCARWSAGSRGWSPRPGRRSRVRTHRCGVSSPGSGPCPSPSSPTGPGAGGCGVGAGILRRRGDHRRVGARTPRRYRRPSAPPATSTSWSTTTSPSYYSENPAGSFALAGVGEQLVGRRPVHRLRDPARHPHPVRAVPERRQRRSRGRADVPRRQGRRLPRPADPARPAGVDRGVPGWRRRDAPGLVGDRRRGTGRAGRCWPSRAAPSSPSPSDWSSCCSLSGLIEALVTPSPLPTFVRIGIGVARRGRLPRYVIHFGRKAVRAGETGDVDDAPDVVPTG